LLGARGTRTGRQSGRRSFSAALGILGLLLQLAAPGLFAPAPVLEAAAPPGLEALLTEICRHSGSDAPFEEPQAPDRQKTHCCQGCCCLVSLAGLLPSPITLADPNEAAAAPSVALKTAAVAALSVYRVRQRGPPTA
jgi:hypothetical protein